MTKKDGDLYKLRPNLSPELARKLLFLSEFEDSPIINPLDSNLDGQGLTKKEREEKEKKDRAFEMWLDSQREFQKRLQAFTRSLGKLQESIDDTKDLIKRNKALMSMRRSRILQNQHKLDSEAVFFDQSGAGFKMDGTQLTDEEVKKVEMKKDAISWEAWGKHKDNEVKADQDETRLNEIEARRKELQEQVNSGTMSEEALEQAEHEVQQMNQEVENIQTNQQDLFASLDADFGFDRPSVSMETDPEGEIKTEEKLTLAFNVQAPGLKNPAPEMKPELKPTLPKPQINRSIGPALTL